MGMASLLEPASSGHSKNCSFWLFIFQPLSVLMLFISCAGAKPEESKINVNVYYTNTLTKMSNWTDNDIGKLLKTLLVRADAKIVRQIQGTARDSVVYDQNMNRQRQQNIEISTVELLHHVLPRACSTRAPKPVFPVG